MARGSVLLQHGQPLAQGEKSREQHCVIGTEQAHEAVVVEGVAEKLRDVEHLKELLSLYQRKYDYDMSTMQEDILALREPIFAVRPSVAFGLEEKTSLQNATRWRFAT